MLSCTIRMCLLFSVHVLIDSSLILNQSRPKIVSKDTHTHMPTLADRPLGEKAESGWEGILWQSHCKSALKQFGLSYFSQVV